MAGVLVLLMGSQWDHRKPLTFLASIGLTIFTVSVSVSGPLTSMLSCKMGRTGDPSAIKQSKMLVNLLT